MEKIPITPQMLRIAVKKLQMRQAFVKSKNLREYIQRHYPVESDCEVLDEELQEKLKYAVYIGLLVKHGDDQYCIPTLRQEANTTKTAFSAFWELYKKVITISLMSISVDLLHDKRSFFSLSSSRIICYATRERRSTVNDRYRIRNRGH